MDHIYKNTPDAADRIVYVRPVAVAELPDDIRNHTAGLTEIYAVHDASGTRLALVRDQRLAFVLARQNDLAPVYVH